MKILFLKECCLGDLLMLSSALVQLKAQCPEAIIDVCVGPFARPVPEHWPFVRQVFEYPRFWGARRRPWGEWLRLMASLRREQYDQIFVCDVGRGAQIIATLIGGQGRVGFVHKHRRIGLHDWVERSPEDGIPEVRSYELLVERVLKKSLTATQYAYTVLPQEQAWADAWLRQRNLNSKNFVVIAPGGGKNPGTDMERKRWPVERYAGLVERMMGARGTVPLLVGAESDRETVEKMGESRTRTGEGIHSLIGESFGNMAALLAQARACVCNDSALLHLAAALRVPTVGIFGPTDPRLLCPLFPWVQSVWEPVECSPCYQQILGTYPPCNDYRCQKGITVERVLEALQKAIKV